MMTTIDELAVRVRNLQAELRQAEADLLSAQQQEAPFQVGDIVEAGREWKPAIVREITIPWRGTCWYKVSYRNKSGEWSNAARSVYNAVRHPA